MKLNEISISTWVRDVKIKSFLKSNDIDKYDIEEDGTVTVHQDVHFYKQPFTKFGCEFNIIHGDFLITECHNLEKLNGPKECENFIIKNCDNFKLVDGKLKKVNGNFRIENCKNISSLEGIPESIKGNFILLNLVKLTKLDFIPKKVGMDLVFFGTPISNILHIFDIKTTKKTTVSFTHGQMSAGPEFNIPNFDQIEKIINKWLPTNDVIECQEELIDAGLKQFARLK